jgi:PAP2 superfamily
VGDATGRGGPGPPATIYGGAPGELDQIDQAVYRAIAATPSPSLDLVPMAWLPLHALAAAVTYSRVHTGVHYPGDVLVGSLMGTGTAVAVRYTGRALTRRSASPTQPGGPTMSGSAGTVPSANTKQERGRKRR